MRDPAHRGARSALLALIATLVVALGACGSDEDDRAAGSADAKAKAAEKAFLTGMVHHHESAIEMAAIAREKGESRFVVDLAESIASTQEREIDEMNEIYERRLGGRLRPDAMAHDGLGLTAEQAGMTHDAGTNDALRRAKPFDRAFVDEMTPHHEGAVRMASVVRKRARDGELRTLAQSIIETQEREIREMSTFRTREYGGPVPKRASHGAGGGEHGADHP